MTLYKYVTPERLDVLTTGLIRYTQAAATNDPFELRPFFESLVTEDYLLKLLKDEPIDVTQQFMKAYEEQPQEIKDKVSREHMLAYVKSVLDSTEGQAAVWDFLRQFLHHLDAFAPRFRDQLADQLGSKVGILSLTEVPDSPVMWAHYAANYTGLVICFNERHPHFDRRRSENDEFLHLRRVRYVKDTHHKSLAGLTGQEIFVTKRDDWSYESEWRILAPLQMADKVLGKAPESIHLFTLPAACIEGVIVGPKAHDSLVSQLRDLRSRDHGFHHLAIAQGRIGVDRPVVQISPLGGAA